MLVKILLAVVILLFIALVIGMCYAASMADDEMERRYSKFLAEDTEQLPDEKPAPAPYINALRSRGFKR